MVSEALDGLTDEQLAELELQESGLVSGQSDGTIASTPFAQRISPQPAVGPQAQPEPAALSDYELNKLEEENYRRVDYVMTPQEFDQYWDRREKEDQEVGRFIEGLGQGAAGLIGMVPEAGRELRDGMVGMVTDPVNQVQRNVQTGAEIVRKAGINLVQLYDWVGSKVDDLTTSSKRAEAINAGIRAQLQAEGRFTGDRTQDEQIYQAALIEARKAGAYKPTAEQVLEDRQKAYDRYVREKSIERDYAGVSQFKTGESAMSSPTSAETYQITDEKPMQTVSQLGAMAIDPVNLIPTGAGALSKARILRRMAVLSEKPLLGVERAAGGLADVAERVETGLSTRIQDITGLTQKQQAALGAGVAGTAVYVDSATESQGGLTKAVMMVGGVLPALHYGGGLLRKVGSAAGGASTIVREAGVGGLGVARAEAAAGLANNAAIPERYRKFFTGYVEGTDSTLKRVAQNADNPEALRRVSRFADRVGATQVAQVADDAVSGAVTAGIVGTPFAALQPDAERAGEVMGGILTLGAAGGVAGGFARRRSPEVADADIARMFADVQASGGNVEAFSRLPHQTLDRLSAMQGVLAGKVDFIPLSGDEYRMNADIAQNAGETTAGVFVDKDTNNRARVFINLDAKTKTESIAPHEIGHAILTSDILDGQPRADLRNLVNQQYGPEGVVARGREYIGRLIDGDARAKTTGEMPTVLTEAEMAAVDGGKTMDDVVADRMKDPAERERLINERFEEFSQRSIDKGQDPLDWARDEIIAETFASEAPAIDFRAIRRDGTFPRIAESMLSAGGRVLEMFGANFSSTGRLLDNPSVLFRDNPLFQDRIMQKRVREYVRSYDQFLAGLEEAGSAAPKGVELARSNNPADLGRSTHVKLRDEGRGVLENDFLFQKPDGTYSFKPQKLINQAETSRAAQIKTLYDARKFVPVNSTEFGKRKVNGRETIGGPVLPPQFDLFTHFPKHVREFARAMEQSRAEGGSWDIDYNAIGTGSSGRYRITNMGAVRAIQRETVPFGWQVTKQNHLLAASLDLNAFRASAMKAINKGELGVFNNDMRQVESDLKTYLGNHRNGLPGEAGIGQAKRDMLNGLIGTGTAVQRTANPLYYELNPKGSIRTWRVDRLNDAKPTGRTGYFFDYDKINNNRMPQALPREAMGMPDGGSVMETYLDREYNPNVLAEQAEREGYQLVYHGDRNQPDNSKYKPWKRAKMPLFTALEPEGADWYGDPRPLFVKTSKIATKQDLINAAKKQNVRGSYDDPNEPPYIPEVSNHSPYEGFNSNDLVYIPRVREELRRQGFDAVRVWDQLERDEIEALIVIGSPDQIVDPLARPATGRTRGQAMPDTDFPISGFHGGPKGITQLRASTPWSKTKGGKDGVIYISTDRAGAEYYSDLRDDGRVYEVSARADNPYFTSDQDLLIDPSPEDVRRLKALGYDAIFPSDPNSTLRAFFNEDQVRLKPTARGQAMPDVIHDDNYTLSPQVPDRGYYIIGTKPTADGRVLEYHVDPRTTLQPRVAGIDSISGEQVAMLEADRHNTRGDNMGGPLHPFLINNQTVVYLPDGRGYKPVWANMNSGFVTRAKNIVKNTTSGHALIQIMKENAHRSNRKFVMDVTAEIDARRASMSDDQADFLHVLLELGAINPQGRINQAYSRVERLSKEVLKKEAELSELAEAQKQYDLTFEKYRPMAEFLTRLSPLKSHSTRGRMKEFQGEFNSLMSKYRNTPWFSSMASKYRNTKFVDEAARFSFKQRGAAMDRITGIPFAPDVKKMLDDSMDFVNGKNLDIVGVVQLSKDADAFAVYFGKNAKEEAKMSANERLLRDQLLASGTFRPHPSYDWVMLGPENADSFILNTPADPLKLFPDYAKNHPNPKVRGGTKETIAGTMKKSKIPLILK